MDFDFSVADYITDFISYLVLVDTPAQISLNLPLLLSNVNFMLGAYFSFTVDFT
jgi:hypothetical protein